MHFLHPFLPALFSGTKSCLQNNPDGLINDLFFSIENNVLFANSGSFKKTTKTAEIRDESGLGSGAGVTPEDQSTFVDRKNSAEEDAELSTSRDDAGATGPGSDRIGDKMPGEGGITSLTDGIANFIDKAEDDDSSEGKRKNKG